MRQQRLKLHIAVEQKPVSVETLCCKCGEISADGLQCLNCGHWIIECGTCINAVKGTD